MFAHQSRAETQLLLHGKDTELFFWNKEKAPDTLKKEQIQMCGEFGWYHKQRLFFTALTKGLAVFSRLDDNFNGFSIFRKMCLDIHIKT